MNYVKWLCLAGLAVAAVACGSAASTEIGDENGGDDGAQAAPEHTEAISPAGDSCGWSCDTTGTTGYLTQRLCLNHCPGGTCSVQSPPCP